MAKEASSRYSDQGTNHRVSTEARDLRAKFRELGLDYEELSAPSEFFQIQTLVPGLLAEVEAQAGILGTESDDLQGALLQLRTTSAQAADAAEEYAATADNRQRFGPPVAFEVVGAGLALATHELTSLELMKQLAARAAEVWQNLQDAVGGVLITIEQELELATQEQSRVERARAQTEAVDTQGHQIMAQGKAESQSLFGAHRAKTETKVEKLKRAARTVSRGIQVLRQPTIVFSRTANQQSGLQKFDLSKVATLAGA